jgi:FtsP/CotA-like multicopper oxidase with cupredoxin domain
MAFKFQRPGPWIFLWIISATLSGLSARAQHPIREYSLTIREQRVNKAGKWVEAVTVNDSIPAPTLYFTEGDSAVIHITNELSEPSSIHWHGILLPNQYDGVPYLTTPPILPGATYTVRFVLRQHGTYWYHSHSMMQEQRGLYGALVIRPTAEKQLADREIVLLFSDWTNASPHHIMKNLKRNTEWYAVKKGQAQSLNRVIAHHGLAERIAMAWQRMPPMDVADVYYNAFLVQGRRSLRFADLKPGERVRLRVIDGSSSTFFHLQYAGGPLEIVAADGMDVAPREVSRMLMGIAETYDFLVTVPDSGSYEFRATAQDGSGYASVFLGNGPVHEAPTLPAPDIYHLAGVQMQGMEGMQMGGMKLGSGVLNREAKYLSKDTLDFEDVRIAGEGAMAGMHMDMHGRDEGPSRSHGTTSGMHHMKMDHMKMDHSMTDDSATDHTMTDHSRMDHTGMDHSPADDSAMDHTMMDQSMMDHSMMDQSMMDHSRMDHTGTDHSRTARPGMSHEQTGALAHGDAEMKEAQPFNYDMLRSLRPTAFDSARHPVRELTFRLTGTMWRYNWSINGKRLSEDDSIQVHEGEVLRVTMINETMMYHPMHLHGHFFRVLNANGAYSPLKHTVIVPPMRSVTIEFLANEPGDWFFHCHVLYHMMAGMSRIFRYTDFRRPASMDPYPLHMLYHDDKHYLGWGEATLASNHAAAEWTYSNPTNQFTLSGEYGWEHGLNEFSGTYEYFMTPYLRPYAGVVTSNKSEYLRYFGKHGRKTPAQDARAVAGLRYLLPFFLNADVRIDSRGHARAGLEGETWLFPRLWLHYGANTDREFHVGLEALLGEHFSLTGGYNSDYRWGGGLQLRF